MSLTYSKVLSIITHNDYNTFHLAYRPGPSTETGHLKAVNDLFISLIKSHMRMLDFIDFSLAFDTIHHSIVVHRFRIDIRFNDTLIQWIYLF